MPHIIYAESESLIKKIDGCANNSENSSITKVEEHIPVGYLMSTIWVFDHIENKHTLHLGEDCVKTLLEYLREHVKNIIDFEKNNY